MKILITLVLVFFLASCSSPPTSTPATEPPAPESPPPSGNDDLAAKQADHAAEMRAAEERERQRREADAMRREEEIRYEEAMRREKEMAQRKAAERKAVERKAQEKAQSMKRAEEEQLKKATAAPPSMPAPLTPTPPPAPAPILPPDELVDVRRYPTIEAPERVVVDQSFSVMVSLTEELITEAVEIVQGQSDELGRLKFSLPEQQEPWEIDVVLSASGFDFASPNRSRIYLPRSGDSTPAMFDLTPRESERLKASRKLYATFWHKGQYLARVQRPIKVSAPERSLKACNQSEARASELAAVVETAETARLSDDRSAADLTIYMRRDWDSCSATDYHVTLSSPHIDTTHERITLPEDIAEWLIPKFNQFSISGRSLQSEVDEEDDDEEEEVFVTRDYMLGFGQQLYQEFAPASFVLAFSQLRDVLGDEFKTIQIYTDEPAIPWELMVPYGSDQSLGLSHAIGRWLIPKHRSNFTVPEQKLEVSKIFLVTPNYEGNLKLYATAGESRFIDGLFGNSEHIEARYSPVKGLLQSSGSSIIHYSGHGYAQRDTAKNVVDYGLILEDERLKALNWRGIMANKQNASLMFFNACEVGLAERTAGFVDGWSQVLTDTGSRGFISSLWELGDRGAAGFSKRFYTELHQQLEANQEANVAEIIRRAKLKFNRSENPTDIAYVYYGDVGLKLSLEDTNGSALLPD